MAKYNFSAGGNAIGGVFGVGFGIADLLNTQAGSGLFGVVEPGLKIVGTTRSVSPMHL